MLILSLAGPAVATDIEEATRLQVFLDRANFGPGKIDGRYGGFSEKALGLYREAHSLPPLAATPAPAKADDKAETTDDETGAKKTEKTIPLPNLSDMDLASVNDVFIEYQVTEADLKTTGELPKEVPAMAELKWLPYASAAEAVAEKFHADIDFLKELNPGKLEALKVGDTLKVPNVEPFDVNGVKDLPLPDLLAMKDADKDDDAEGKKKDKDTPKTADKKDKKKGRDAESNDNPKAVEPTAEQGGLLSAKQIAIKVSTEDNMLRLFENEKLVAAYPVTIGSAQTKSPVGEWKVKGIARLPDFRYDLSFLNTGERGDKTYLLHPGPNNPVGIVWIATNKPGIGLHGTSDPDGIGRSASHGCVRLANWDIARLATHVRAGVMVSIH